MTNVIDEGVLKLGIYVSSTLSLMSNVRRIFSKADEEVAEAEQEMYLTVLLLLSLLVKVQVVSRQSKQLLQEKKN